MDWRFVTIALSSPRAARVVTARSMAGRL